MTNRVRELGEPIEASLASITGERTTWSTVNYKCHNCGETDSDGVLEGKSPVMALNCWNCGAGKNLDPMQQFAAKKGMCLIVEEVAA